MDYFSRPYTQYGQPQNNPYMANFQPTVAHQQQPAPMRTNKIFVTSLEDALNRYAEPNTIMVYRHQDEQFEYEITTDSQGKKTYKTVELSDYSTPQADKQTSITQISVDEFNSLKNRIKSLENEVMKKYKDQRRIEKNEVENEESR